MDSILYVLKILKKRAADLERDENVRGAYESAAEMLEYGLKNNDEILEMFDVEYF